jgi:hypothetical protein
MSSVAAPRVLIVAFSNYSGIAHLPKSLVVAGYRVAAFCPYEYHLSKTKYLEKTFLFNNLFFYWKIRKELIDAIRNWQPDLIMAGDDFALSFLQNIYFQLLSEGEKELAELLTGSLGFPGTYGVCTDKYLFGKTAEKLGFNTPKQYLARNRREVAEAGEKLGYPCVFKKTLSPAGTGVAVCRNTGELAKNAGGFFGNGSGPGLKDRLRWELHKARGADLRHLMSPQEESVLVQKFIEGAVVSHTFATSNGVYLGGYSYENMNTGASSTEPSRSIRVLAPLPECEDISRKLAAYLGLCGFACIDFIIDSEGTVYILECNARPSHTTNFGIKAGADLPGMLLKADAMPVAPQNEDLIFSLFPDALKNDPQDFTPQNSLIPWEDPLLLASLLTPSHLPPISKKWLVRMALGWVKEQIASIRNRNMLRASIEMASVIRSTENQGDFLLEPEAALR